MNLKKLSEKELVEIINTTQDLTLLEKAENEYVSRIQAEETEPEEDYDDIITEVRKTFPEGN